MTPKWLPSLPILMQESFWWWQCSDRYIVSLSPPPPILPTPPPPPPFSASLISLLVSVDVKHYVYQRASTGKATDLLRSPPDNICLFPAWQWEDFPNYNRGMDRYFSCFFGRYQSVWTECRRRLDWLCKWQSDAADDTKDEAPYRLSFYLDTTRPKSQHHSLPIQKWVDWHPKKQNKR